MSKSLIWELLPIETESPHWRLSSHCGRAVVRAASEREARFEAQCRFAQASPRLNLYEDTPTDPWSLGELVACRVMDDSPHPVEGTAGVLEPAGPND